MLKNIQKNSQPTNTSKRVASTKVVSDTPKGAWYFPKDLAEIYRELKARQHNNLVALRDLGTMYNFKPTFIKSNLLISLQC